MSKKPINQSGNSEVDIERRKFLKGGGAAIAAGLAAPMLTGADSALAAGARDETFRVTFPHGPGGAWKKPNIIIVITDEERYPMHWPTGWADANLPNHKLLADQGLTFTNACTAASPCSPSRSALFSGLYPVENGVTTNVGSAGSPELSPTLPNMATMLASAGYEVQYRGKWHLSNDPSGTTLVGCARELENFGFCGWQPPEAGCTLNAFQFGGGTTDYDESYAAGAADFLKNRNSSKPFALIVSLVNPHDVCGYPGTGSQGAGWNWTSESTIPPYKGTANYANVDLNASPLDQIQLPPNFAQDPYKPACQAESNTQMIGMLGPLTDDAECLNYVRYYAYLHMVVDQQIGTVVDALKSRHDLYKDTIVIRVADHGDMGMSHGGQRQKMYNAYEETIHTPLVISNPVLFPKPVQTSALASNMDIMPTLASIAGVREKPTLRGVDLTPIIRDAVEHPTNPTVTVQDGVLFTFDQQTAESNGIVSQPCCIRCLRQDRWKIAMYFDPNGTAATVYELYDLQNDPLEQNNLGNPSNPAYNGTMLATMQKALQAKMEATNTANLTL
jgi:choline-sulfatase